MPRRKSHVLLYIILFSLREIPSALRCILFPFSNTEKFTTEFSKVDSFRNNFFEIYVVFYVSPRNDSTVAYITHTHTSGMCGSAPQDIAVGLMIPPVFLYSRVQYYNNTFDNDLYIFSYLSDPLLSLLLSFSLKRRYATLYYYFVIRQRNPPLSPGNFIK